MANRLISNHHGKAFHALCLFVIFTMAQKAGATQFKVGGSNGWTVPKDPNALNKWAESKRFQIDDSLLFVYQPDKDSVLQVTKQDYENCNTKSFITSSSDGNTIIKFNQSGHHYFISGFNDNCPKHEKLVVVVMAERRNKQVSTNETTFASPPNPLGPPEITPPMAPAGEVSPSPPPPLLSGSPESSPSMAPVGVESPPPPSPSGASSKVISFMGCSGVLLGLSLHIIM